MRALAAARRNPVALTNLGAFFGMEVTAGGLSICTVLQESLKHRKGAQRQYVSMTQHIHAGSLHYRPLGAILRAKSIHIAVCCSS